MILLRDLRSKNSTWFLTRVSCLHTERVILRFANSTSASMRVLTLLIAFSTVADCLFTCSRLVAGLTGES